MRWQRSLAAGEGPAAFLRLSWLLILLCGAPPPAPAGPAEPDARAVPWTALRRLSLEAGRPLPLCRPLSETEIADLLAEVAGASTDALEDAGERALLARLRARYANEPAACVRTGGRGRGGLFELGEIVAGQAGLAAPAGLSVVFEPWLTAQRGRTWLTACPRLKGRISGGGRALPPLLDYADWPAATWGPVRGAARRDEGPWRLDWPLAAAGVQLGGWAIAGGRFPAATGLGDGGGLILDDTAPSFPCVVVRRRAPFAWRGFLSPLAPRQLLLRVGRLSERAAAAATGWSPPRSWRDEPWFLQWLVAWEPARWLTSGASLGALALPRAGTLWPDVFQVAFPALSATENELERGPVTDRIFSVMFEARWRGAPWIVLPSAAGRVYWEYGGEDFNPPGLVPLVPQISAPASVLGAELVGPRWDLLVEFAELEHPRVLWYAHHAFDDGYAHDGWVLGHPLGGGGRSLAGEARWRPRGSGRELVLRGERMTTGRPGATPGRARRWTGEMSWRAADGLGPWGATAAWTRERVELFTGAAASADWWSLQLVLQK